MGVAVLVMSDQRRKRMFGETAAPVPYKGKQLQGYSEHEAQVIGQAQVNVGYGHRKHQLPLLDVAGNQRPPMFGQNWLQSIQLYWALLHQLQ